MRERSRFFALTGCFIFLLGFFLHAHSATAQTAFQTASPTAAGLRILSYNIHGLPGLLVPDKGQYARIGDILSERRKAGLAPQIVAIQQGWDFDGTAATLTEHSGYPYVVHGADTKFGKLLSSGIHVLSEYPFEVVNRVT